MNISEALRKVTKCDGQWVRPISWRGSGLALMCFLQHRIAIVPSPTGGSPWHANYDDIVGEWELVAVTTVLDEVSNIYE